MSFRAIASQTLGSNQASVTFSNIPQTFRDLRLVIVANTTDLANILFLINNDGAGIYSKQTMVARSLNTNPYAETNTTGSGHLNWITATTSTVRSAGTIDFFDYAVTDKHKSYLSRTNTQEGNNTYSGVEAIAGRYGSTNAITEIQVLPGSGSFVSGATFSLYGVNA